ncbi:hypothetical protein EVAR_40510_1 [Eumeta japonica]|uniref:Zinc finger MYM-type protein 5 n=1 Tax=Eumeta variegata TaxID=151549 RepID=A0A4C1XZK8_EUMVA|nr:hypothetical protein EVAR_40510_1 [Eumeta japonica]
MDNKKKPSSTFKRKQRQEREDIKQKLPKIDRFFSQSSASTSGQNISNDSDSNNVVTVVLVEKPTEEDSTIIAVGDTSAAHRVNVNDVCMAHIRAEDLEEPQTSTFFENVYDKSSYDLGNFTNKILSDNEKHQILDMGPLQPSEPFPPDINQNNRCFSKSYYVSSSKYGPVNRFWLFYSKILDTAYCQPYCLLASQRNNVWCMGIRDWKHLSEKIKQPSCSSGHLQACAMYEFWKKNDTNTIDKELENESIILENGSLKVIRYHTYPSKELFGFERTSRRLKSGRISWKFSVLCRAYRPI